MAEHKNAAVRHLDRTAPLGRFGPAVFPGDVAFLGGAALGGAALWFAVVFVYEQNYPLAHRLLSPLPMGLLVAALVANQGLGAEGLYLRAHKKEPLVWLSLLLAGLIASGSLLLVQRYGATGMMLNYFFVQLVVGLGGGTWIFIQKRREWH